MIILMMNNGGLGNQMFQYAAARAVAEMRNEKIYCNISRFNYKNSNATQRPLEIQKFLLCDDFTIKKEKKYKIIYKLLSILQKDSVIQPKDYFSYKEIQLERNKILCLNGLFQNHRYFNDIRMKLRTEFIVESCNVFNNNLISKLKMENSVCVHWRRGDYLEKQYSALNVCDLEYYNKALDVIKKRVNNPTIYVFTNTKEDAMYIKNEYWNLEDDIHYINLLDSRSNRDIDDFILMRSCKHFIISNSTYSWWAQYLSEDFDEQVIIAPSIWTKENVDTSGLYQKNWITI